jgi:hypothetical protein
MRACRRHRKTGRLCLAVGARLELVRAGALWRHHAVGRAVLTIINRRGERSCDYRCVQALEAMSHAAADCHEIGTALSAIPIRQRSVIGEPLVVALKATTFGVPRRCSRAEAVRAAPAR